MKPPAGRATEATSGRVQVRWHYVWRLGLGVLVALAAVLGAAYTKPAYGASTITVDCTADASALTTALAVANDGDTLAIQGTCSGTFEIARSLTLIGAAGATLDAHGAGTVLTIDSGEAVAVNGLTITGGSGLVAGISNTGGTLTLTNTTVNGNTASVPQFRNGVGGIFNIGGSVTLTNSTVSGNSASATAPLDTAVGGILNFAVLTLTRSTVSGNSASTPSDAFGGILNSGPGGIVTVTNSTVSGNTAIAPGGVSVFSSTVGGISNSGGSLTLLSSTLSTNSVSEPNGGFLPPVGGISNFFGGTLTVANSLLSGQSGGPNCFGLAPSSDGGYNLDDGTSCGFASANHSLSSTDPLLDPTGVKNNGGPTQTIALLPGSPAIDAIPAGVNGCGTTLASDQRGVTRPQSSGCDIGAFEFVVTTFAVAIDIKPGGFPNAINPGSNGLTPVAILSTPSFNAGTQLDTASLRFGRTGNEASLAFCGPPQDVNGDRLLDLVCRFTTQTTQFQPGDTQGVLTGKTVGGTPIRGTDSVVLVPPPT